MLSDFSQQFEFKATAQTHVSARDKSSCWGFWISSSACFWTVCQPYRLSPPVPSFDTPSSSPLNTGCYHWQPAPLACKAWSVRLPRGFCAHDSLLVSITAQLSGTRICLNLFHSAASLHYIKPDDMYCTDVGELNETDSVNRFK